MWESRERNAPQAGLAGCPLVPTTHPPCPPHRSDHPPTTTTTKHTLAHSPPHLSDHVAQRLALRGHHENVGRGIGSSQLAAHQPAQEGGGSARQACLDLLRLRESGAALHRQGARLVPCRQQAGLTLWSGRHCPEAHRGTRAGALACCSVSMPRCQRRNGCAGGPVTTAHPQAGRGRLGRPAGRDRLGESPRLLTSTAVRAPRLHAVRAPAGCSPPWRGRHPRRPAGRRARAPAAGAAGPGSSPGSPAGQKQYTLSI